MPASEPVAVDSDGWIRVDDAQPASEPACNVPAAQILVLQRKVAAQKTKSMLLDCNERADLADARARNAQNAAKDATLFGKYGIQSGVLGLLLGIAAGLVVGLEVGIRK